MLVTRVGAAVVIGPVSGYNEASIRIRDGGSFRGATHVRTDAVRAHFEAVANGGHPSVLGFRLRRIYRIYARPRRNRSEARGSIHRCRTTPACTIPARCGGRATDYSSRSTPS